MKPGRAYSMQRRQGGMALIVVLWLVVLLSIMATGHSRNVHTDTTLAARQMQSAKARALAEAGVSHVILEMLAADTDRKLPLDGSVFNVRVGEEDVVLAVRDATGLVNLNTAEPQFLDAVLKACGVNETASRDLVDAILDWRDKDNLSHLHGAEDDDYVAAGVAWTSRDGAFEAVDELKYLPGMTQGLYDRLSPLVTVYSGRGDLNLEYAPPVLIAALTGRELSSVEAEDSGRETSGPRDGTFHIYASASGSASTVVSIEVVVKISRKSESPYTIVGWREPPLAEFPPREGVQG